MQRVRPVPLVVIAIISLALLIGGYQAYQRFYVIDPVADQLRAIPGVESVQVSPGHPATVRVQLGAVHDLQTTYDDVTKVVQDTLGDGANVVLVDNADGALQNAYESLLPYILQGVAEGHYADMIDTVRQRAQKMGMDAQITMDEHNLYIELRSGDHELYHVLPYALRQGGGAS